MAKESDQVMRVDVRIPMTIFNKIEDLAEQTNQDFTPTTKPNHDGTLKKDKDGNDIIPKRAVTPVILDLISIALESLESGEISEESIGINNKNLLGGETEKKILDTLQVKMEGILLDKISNIIEDKFKSYLSSAPQTQSTKTVNINHFTTDIKQGLSSMQLSERFKLHPHKKGEGAKKTTILSNLKKMPKSEFIEWTKQNDFEGVGWYRTKEKDTKFYPCLQD